MPTLAQDKLGATLVHRKLIDAGQLRQAQRAAQMEKRTLQQVLLLNKTVDGAVLYGVISEIIGIPFVDLATFIFDPKILKILSADTARKLQAIPLFKIGSTLSVALTDPTDILKVDQLRSKTGCKIETYLCSESEMLHSLEHFYPSTGIENLVKEMGQEEAYATSLRDALDGPGEAVLGGEENRVIKLVNLIFEQAVRDGASDIHIEPDKDILRIRLRIDGILHEIPSPPKYMESSIVSRVKVLSELNIAENRVPQDGRFRTRVDNRDIDVRVSTIPTVHGENVVMRILDTASVNIGLENLGFSKHNMEIFTQLIACPYGMILVTGPTGSGKTTTLYCALQRINSIDKHIVTIEDPVEYRLELIRQIQVNAVTGMDFANGLRSIVRQDPDVIMVGEIRDLPTAEIAVQSAMTGHLVFSTLHTNDSAGAITRMVDMGIEPFLISSSVIGVAAQRLVRRVCEKCKEIYVPSVKILERLGLAGTGAQFYRGRGCRFCKNTGYKGRVAIAEILVIDDEIRELVVAKSHSGDIRKAGEKAGMITLGKDGLEKVCQGITTLEEVSRVTQLDILV